MFLELVGLGAFVGGFNKALLIIAEVFLFWITLLCFLS